MIYKYEFVLNLALQIILIFVGLSMTDRKRSKVISLSWILAIVNNVFHMYLLRSLLIDDIGPDDKELFTKELIVLVVLTAFVAIYQATRKLLKDTQALILIGCILNVAVCIYLVCISNWKMALVLVEVNAFPLVLEAISRRK